MKKLVKLFGFALVAMVLFAGCGKKDKWKDVTEDCSKIELTDGDWVATSYYYEEVDVTKAPSEMAVIIGMAGVTSGTITIEKESEIDFTVKDGKVDVTSEETISSIEFPSDTETIKIDAVVEAAKLMDPDADISRKGTKLKSKDTTAEAKLRKGVAVDNFVDMLEDEVDLSKLKTNEDKTKYRYYEKAEDGKSEVEMTLAKD